MTDDQSTDGERIDLPSTDHIEQGDIFPYSSCGGIAYGVVEEIDRSRDRQFKVSLSPKSAFIWLNATHYEPDGEPCEILSETTASDLYWRVSRYDGR